MSVSEDVLRLVRTVERLPSEDQDKILRMVDLLTLVPANANVALHALQPPHDVFVSLVLHGSSQAVPLPPPPRGGLAIKLAGGSRAVKPSTL